MKVYINLYQTDSNQEILQPVFFSKDNATRKLQELARKRNKELREQAVVTQLHIDGEQTKIHFANKTETFETKELETEDIGYIAESILKKESFPVTCVAREDLESRGFDTSSVTDNQMDRLADKMGDDYVDQMFWESLDIIAEEGLGIPRKKETLEDILPQDGSEVNISDQDDAPSWTFFDDDNNGYTDRATAIRLRNGKVEVRWEGERCSPANWEPLEWIWDDGDYINFENDLIECVRFALNKNQSKSSASPVSRQGVCREPNGSRKCSG